MELTTTSTEKGKLMKAAMINHIQSIFLKNDTSHVYTTCGYKILTQGENKKVFAYFIHNSLCVVVKMPCQNSCYHMLGGKIGAHQTSVPVILDGEKARICDNDVLIFAWGGGEAAKSPRRQFLDGVNLKIEGWKVTNVNI